ncbi:MAG: hypothetical protein RL685_6709, partial [Pseudomonadota bacterium]
MERSAAARDGEAQELIHAGEVERLLHTWILNLVEEGLCLGRE